MLRLLTFSFGLLFLIGGLSGQTPWYRPVEHHIGRNYFIEGSFGGSLSNYYYTRGINNQLKHTVALHENFGLAFRIQQKKHFSFAAALGIEKQGIHIADEIDYWLVAKYVTCYIPIEYNWLMLPKTRSKSGYFISLAPYFGLPFGGQVGYETYLLDLSKASMAPFDAGFEVGGGVRIVTFSASATTNIRIKLSFCQGFIDTYSQMEKQGTAIALNQSNYMLEGKRLNQMLKLTLGLEFPFKQRETVSFVAGGDGKRNYKRFVNIY